MDCGSAEEHHLHEVCPPIVDMARVSSPKTKSQSAMSKGAMKSDPVNANQAAESEAAKTLPKSRGSVRVVRSLPVRGTIPLAAIRRAVRAVAAERKRGLGRK